MAEYITDRTQADVDRVKALRRIGWQNMTVEEMLEWQGALKGAYNYTDLNRVESAVARIAAEVGLTVDTKTDWAVNDTPTVEQMQRYLDNVMLIRQKVPLPPVYPMPTTTMHGFDYTKANEIEMSLQRCEETVNAVFRSGEIFSGEW